MKINRSTALFIFLATAVISTTSVNATAQTQDNSPAATASPSPQTQTPASTPPAANPADVASSEAIIAAVYDVISGPIGKKRDWNRMRSLFIPEARMIPIVPRKSGGFGARVGSVEDYIKGSGNYLETQGFFETEIARTSERFGNIVHVFSTYESRHKAEDAKPFARGINSIQLMYDGKRWWVMTIAWETERPDNPLPAKYLPQGK
ncbi:MAG: hypothetical protein MSG64_10230 [Pyrinomonadaceae bacterium MAG19_C2-C3]|nr:hypothetical protein [Pyrinomonadaceae bacterium MAG19_C2-C3]